MNPFSRDELLTLLDNAAEPCVSIYLSTYRTSGDMREGALRLKNLVREAEGRLAAVGLAPAASRELLAPVRRHIDERPFWQEASDGLAVFAAPGLFRYYHLPEPFAELAVVAGRFHFQPLLPLLRGQAEFCVLALSQNQVRLYAATPYSIRPVELEGMPRSLADALQYDDPERQLQFHTGAPRGAGGRRAGVFYGHGAGGDEQNARLLRWFRQVDRAVARWVRDPRAPLVLAGVEYLLPIYRAANAYPLLVDGGITGNPETTPPAELHRQAWALVRPYLDRDRAAAADRYRELAGTGRTANDVAAIVPAAHHGRVETLFVAAGRQQWGRYDAESGAVALLDEAGPGAADLLDLAAVHTYLSGGAVYLVDVAEMPDSASVAAVMRY